MEFSSKVWRWICVGVAAVCLVITLGIGLREHHTIKQFEGERIELQDSILSLNREILERDQAVVAAEQAWQEVHSNHVIETKLLQAELAKIRKNYREALAEMSDLDTSELKNYFAERYGECADTVVDSARFLLTVDVGNHIRYDLTEFDFCSEESGLKDSLIGEQSRYIGNLDTMVGVLSVEKSYYMNRAESFEQQFNMSEQARANVQASLNKQQTMSYILGGTAAVLAIGLVTSIIMGGK